MIQGGLRILLYLCMCVRVYYNNDGSGDLEDSIKG
jgi:hypothetical protein